jgi:hypothetical protein
MMLLSIQKRAGAENENQDPETAVRRVTGIGALVAPVAISVSIATRCKHMSFHKIQEVKICETSSCLYYW